MRTEEPTVWAIDWRIQYSVERCRPLLGTVSCWSKGRRIALLCLPYRIGFRFSYIACSYAPRCAGVRLVTAELITAAAVSLINFN